MGEIFANSYFFRLPNEVLIKILSDIDIVSLLHFCEVYGCDYFLQDRNVIRTINVQKNYVLHDLNQVSTKINHEYVTTLNINGLYWVQLPKLRKFISMLRNLERLYAIHSNLSLTKADIKVYSEMKIKKLAVSVVGNDELVTNEIPTLETLYINIGEGFGLSHYLMLEAVCPNVKKIWVNVERSFSQPRFLFGVSLVKKFKVYCHFDAPMPPINFDHHGLTTFYTNRRPYQSFDMCCERFSKVQKPPTNSFNSKGWQVLEELHYNKPYGPKDAHRLYLNGNKLDDMFFEELNFAHNGPVCNERCRAAIREILVSTNAQRLRKLCIMTCLFQDAKASEPNYVEKSNGFKRKRRGVETSKASNSIFDNFPQLRELAMFVCTETVHRSAIQGFPLISSFAGLQSLKIEVPVTCDGSFMSEIFLKCQRLQVLRISSLAQNEKLDFNLCNSVREATSLEDFVYENYRIHFDRLLEQLASIKSRKLQRILLNCTTVDKFSAGPFKNFMEMNPQLIFLYFAISDLTVAAQRMAQSTVKLYKKNHPAKAFFVNKSTEIFKRTRYPIPDVHYSEIMNSNNIKIATLDALEDFEFF